MKIEGLASDLERIRRVFPSLDAGSENGGWLVIRSYPLPSRYNRGSANVLFRLFLGLPYHEPHIYVPTGLDLLGIHSMHLDFATEPEMRSKGWKRLCIKMAWRPEYCLLDVVHLAIDYLNNLTE